MKVIERVILRVLITGEKRVFCIILYPYEMMLVKSTHDAAPFKLVQGCMSILSQ